MDTATKSYHHSYGHSNKELLRNNAHIHLFYQVTRVINVFNSVGYKDINMSTAITELIQKLNIINKQEKINRREENEIGY